MAGRGWNPSEEEMAAEVVRWLRHLHWTVHQEVCVNGRTADIVAMRKFKHATIVWIIECKKRYGMDVLAQAWKWNGYAHRISVAYLSRKSKYASNFEAFIARNLGIGLIDVSQPPDADNEWAPRDFYNIREPVAAPLHRTPRIVEDVRRMLCEENHDGLAAGTKTGERWTPWKQVVKEVTKFVEENPGCTIKEVVAKVPHHWASDDSAYSALGSQIEIGIITGIVKWRGKAGRVFLYIEGTEPPPYRKPTAQRRLEI